VAEVPVKLVGIKAEGLLVARCGNEATRCRGGATHRNGLGTCHSKGAAVVVEEDATTMTKFFFVRVIAKGLKVINCLFVGNEVEQSQELAVDAARGSHTRWQESHMSGFVCTGRDSGESCQQRRCQVVCPDYQGCEADPDSGHCAQRRQSRDAG